jgi:hypothetical protein
MSRRAAIITQADVARACRAAKALGSQWYVEIEAGTGTIRVMQGAAGSAIASARPRMRSRASVRARARHSAIGDPMPPKLPPFLHREINRHGPPIWYFRRGHGRRIRLPSQYGSADFLAAYDAALGGRANTKARRLALSLGG